MELIKWKYKTPPDLNGSREKALQGQEAIDSNLLGPSTRAEACKRRTMVLFVSNKHKLPAFNPIASRYHAATFQFWSPAATSCPCAWVRFKSTSYTRGISSLQVHVRTSSACSVCRIPYPRCVILKAFRTHHSAKMQCFNIRSRICKHNTCRMAKAVKDHRIKTGRTFE